MGDDRMQKSKDRIAAWMAQQVEIGDRTGAAQADANQPRTEPVGATMDAPREDVPAVVSPDTGEAGVETVLGNAPGDLARDRVR